MKFRKHRIKEERTLSDEWGKLRSVTYDLEGQDGKMQEHTGELYDAGNAVAVLLYDASRGVVLLARQFRLAATYNGHPDGMLTEVCAGKIENGLSPEETARKEILEETGYAVKELRAVMELYSSPGALTEKLYLFAAAYTPADKEKEGGGRKEEGEAIEVVELPFGKAKAMLRRGEIVDAKTAILLQWAAGAGIFGA